MVFPLPLTLSDFVKAAFENHAVLLERRLLLFTATVVLGLLLEYGAEFAKHFPFPKRLLPKTPKHFVWVTPFEIVGGILITVGVAGELYVAAKASSIQETLRSINDGIIAGLNKRAGDAIKDSSDAQERASANEKEAARLNKLAEDERTARVKIQAKVAWRRLTDLQKVDFGTAVAKRFSNQVVSFWYNTGDIEASEFAADIAEALSTAKTLRIFPPASISVVRGSGGAGAPVRRADTGVKVQSTRDDASRALADAISSELVIRGFDATRPTDADPNPAPQVWVNVEPRPEGPQGEFKLAAQRSASAAKK